jgi:hypothetical protein
VRNRSDTRNRLIAPATAPTLAIEGAGAFTVWAYAAWSAPRGWLSKLIKIEPSHSQAHRHSQSTCCIATEDIHCRRNPSIHSRRNPVPCRGCPWCTLASAGRARPMLVQRATDLLSHAIASRVLGMCSWIYQERRQGVCALGRQKVASAAGLRAAGSSGSRACTGPISSALKITRLRRRRVLQRRRC